MIVVRAVRATPPRPEFACHKLPIARGDQHDCVPLGFLHVRRKIFNLRRRYGDKETMAEIRAMEFTGPSADWIYA